MDDRRFDDLTRFVGRRASRRAVVKGAAAAALAAVFGRATRGDDAAEAAIYQQGGVKQRVRVYCTQAGQKCKDSRNPTRRCCYKCNGSLNNPNSKCCEDEGFACVTDNHCCEGRICRDPGPFDGVNLKGCFEAGELEYGAECRGDTECSSSMCVEGICCSAERTCTDAYTGMSTCCDPSETCRDGACGPCPRGWFVLPDGDCGSLCDEQGNCPHDWCHCRDTSDGVLCVDVVSVGAPCSDGPCPAGYTCSSNSCLPLCGPGYIAP